LAKLHSKFPWAQYGENSYLLSAPGVQIFIEVDRQGQYEVYKKPSDLPPGEAYGIFPDPENAFALADSMVPDEAMKSLEAKARWWR
jgi:hypothetical protein